MIRNPNLGEINFEEVALQGALQELCHLRHGTSYLHRNPQLFMLSNSDTADQMEEMFKLLQETEETFLELLDNTITALENAGVSFAEAEKAAQVHIMSLETLTEVVR